MKNVLARKPSPAMVVAIVALFVAASGTAVAASKLTSGDALISPNSLSGNRLRSHTLTAKQVNLGKLGVVPASKVKTFKAKLAFGQTKALFKAGTLTFSAKCVQNGTDPSNKTGKDFAELLVSTSKNGGTFTSGDGNGLDGSSSLNFLKTTTAETSRAVAWQSADTGFSIAGIENGMAGYGMDAIDPNGVVVIIPDGLTLAVNLFGSKCLVAGTAIVP
jgi:hypothetical protein